MAANYRKDVFWSAEDEGWIATSPEFPGLSAFGESDIEALAELNNAIEAASETYASEGWRLPEPGASRGDFSGQLRLRIPKYLHAAATRRAQAEGVSLNSMLQAFIAVGLGASQGSEDLQKRAEALLQFAMSQVDLHELAAGKLAAEAWIPSSGKTGQRRKLAAFPLYADTGPSDDPWLPINASGFGAPLKRFKPESAIDLVPNEVIK
ncbi:MAG: type II toxin-antitoxin system HicB family antitoxin [Gemmatimonadota bacterium]|nr:type II toxin-antitoxin system HicB family antitoxin [Gemmatimonadota bacterium]